MTQAKETHSRKVELPLSPWPEEEVRLEAEIQAFRRRCIELWPSRVTHPPLTGAAAGFWGFNPSRWDD